MCICTLATSGLQGGRVPQDKKAPSILFLHWVMTSLTTVPETVWVCCPHLVLIQHWLNDVRSRSFQKQNQQKETDRLGEEKQEQDEKMKCSHRGNHERNLSENLWSHGSHIFPPLFLLFLWRLINPCKIPRSSYFFFQSGNTGPRPEVVQLSQSLKQQLPKWWVVLSKMSYLANRQMARKVQFVGTVFTIWEGSWPNSQKSIDSEARVCHLGFGFETLQVPS